MNKSKLASWIVAGALALGSGIAMAETAPENPEVIGDPDETTTTTAEETTTTTVDATTTTTVDENDGDTEGEETEGDTESDGAKAHPDNHGKVVSEAARDHSRDEEFGNHGKYVSSVARGDKANEAEGKSAGKAKGGKPAKGADTAENE